MGRERKRRPLDESVQNALAVTLEGDVMGLEALGEFPELMKEPPRNQVIMAATALGMSQPMIADAFGVSQPTINEIINRIDPQRKMRAGKDARKAFLTRLYESRAMEAVGSITFDEIKQLNALEKGKLSKLCSEAMANLNASKHREKSVSRLDMLLEQVEAEVGGAPYEEGN